MNHAWLALVALPEARLPAPDRVLAELPVDGDAHASLSSQTANMATFSWGSGVAAYTLVDRPIPARQLAGPCECAWYWPESAACFAAHRAHLIVALVDEAGPRVSQSIRFTNFVAAVLAASPALGLQWGPSRQVHDPASFRSVAAKMDKSDLPLFLWIDFRVERSEVEGVLRLFTTGMVALGHRELEVPHFAGDAPALTNHVYNVAHYALTKNAPLRDGEVIGLTDETRCAVRETPSMLGDGTEVVTLDFVNLPEA